MTVSFYAVRTVEELAEVIKRKARTGDQLTIVNTYCDGDAGYTLHVIRAE